VTAKGGRSGPTPEIVAGHEIGRNEWEIATRFEDNVQCAGGKVTVGGKLKVEFQQDTWSDIEPKGERVHLGSGKGVMVLLPADALKEVGATGPGRTYKVERVELKFGGAHSIGPKIRWPDLVMKIFFVSKPNGVNTAQGDISPGNTFTLGLFTKKYAIGGRSSLRNTKRVKWFGLTTSRGWMLVVRA
jgi:hypothetical protein